MKVVFRGKHACSILIYWFSVRILENEGSFSERNTDIRDFLHEIEIRSGTNLVFPNSWEIVAF